MDAQEALDGCFQDSIMEPSPELINPSSKKPPSQSTSTANECFDCNICLDFAADPVVTLCGHLYCWPCIFRWLHLDSAPRHCPVCKSTLSETSLVPLYGRGLNSKPLRPVDGVIPDRPRDHRSFSSPAIAAGGSRPPRQGFRSYQNHLFYNDGRMNHMGILHSTAGSVLGEMAFAMLPWAFRSHETFYANSNQSSAVGVRNQRWLQELRVESWLNQLWVFLVCCAFLCLVFF